MSSFRMADYKGETLVNQVGVRVSTNEVRHGGLYRDLHGLGYYIGSEARQEPSPHLPGLMRMLTNFLKAKKVD